MTRVIIKLSIFIILFSLLISGTSPALAGDRAVNGLDTAATEGFGETPEITDIPSLIGRLLGVALQFLGLAFFLLMLYGGFLWMFARGNEAQVTKAKELITAAVIGLIIVLSAYAITMFVGSILTNS